MKKTIQYAVKNEGSKLLMQITEQSHTDVEFGKDGTNCFKASNGFELYSSSHPADVVDGSRDRFYMRGSDKSMDLHWAPVTIAHLPKLLAAIEEYNQHDFVEDSGINRVDSEYREGAEQLKTLMTDELDDMLDEVPEEYRKAAVAAWVFGVWGFKSYKQALNELGCQKDKVRQMLADIKAKG